MIPRSSAIAFAAGLLLAAGLPAQTPLTTQVVASGLSRPVFVTSPPGDLGRIFILEQHAARVRIVENGVLLPTPFLDINPKVINSGNERGLLGMAFHPDYELNGFFYLNYNDNGGTTIIERYSVSAANPNLADLASGLILMRVPQDFSNHNGGMVAFGPDGYLYIGMGDGGSSYDPNGRAQSGSSLLGKMLRIDVDSSSPYAIPPSNPFVRNTAFRDEIWAYGLRNPWRFSFDRESGDLYIGDVGQNQIEEVDFQAAASPGGENYGWRCMEGTRCTGRSGCTCNGPTLVPPIHEYPHSQGCSITGGYVYRGCAIPDLDGTYFFADYCSARIWSFRYAGGQKTEFRDRTSELGAGSGLSSFGEDGFGEMYVCNLSGTVRKIVPRVAPPDCNGNGVPDTCDIATGTSLDLNGNGQPDECELLSADVARISARMGGTQSFALHAGSANAGRTYLLVGSLSGTVPGINLGVATLPLNLDAYLALTLQGPNAPPLANSFGTLDASGRSQASFTLPAGFPGLAGLDAYHAYALVLPSLDVTSNFVSLHFEM